MSLLCKTPSSLKPKKHLNGDQRPLTSIVRFTPIFKANIFVQAVIICQQYQHTLYIDSYVFGHVDAIFFEKKTYVFGLNYLKQF